MVAVHVHAIGGDPGAGGRTVRVGTGHHDDVDAVQQGLQQTLRQLTAEHQQCFTTRWFITMLLAYQNHGRATTGFQCCGVGVCRACGHHTEDRFAALRHPQVEQLGARGAGLGGVGE
ncbi:hypothetical protein D3C71_1734640 [compost metagenome]